MDHLYPARGAAGGVGSSSATAPPIRGIALLHHAGHVAIGELNSLIEQAARIRYNLHGNNDAPKSPTPERPSNPDTLKEVHMTIEEKLRSLRDLMNEIESGE